MAIDKEKQRARWRRNKRAQRLLQKASEPVPHPINKEFAERVWRERNKRMQNFPFFLPYFPKHQYYQRDLGHDTRPFVCDVWAVLILLESQKPGEKVSSGMIAKCLETLGRTRGLKFGSIRTKVWRARRLIKYLEDVPAGEGEGPLWPKFPESITYVTPYNLYKEEEFSISELLKKSS